MKFLRTAPTRRLLAVLAGLVVAVAAGTAIAVAAGSGGPVPPPKPLSSAIHQALTAPTVTGITAHIKFTNNLIPSSDLQGSDPILNGASGRLWITSDHRLRLELQSADGRGNDGELVVNQNSFWVYDPMARTVYEGTLPSQSAHQGTAKAGRDTLPSIAQIQSQLNQLASHLNISGAIPGDIAGQAAYTVRVSPKHDGGLLGAVQLGWDALRGVPLRFSLYAKNSSTPVLELTATNIHYGTVPASDLRTQAPAGTSVVKVSPPASSANGAHGNENAKHQDITGAAAVAKHLSFPLVAPSKLVGLPRQSVQLLDWGGSPAALVSYGQNLGGIAVIEQTASATKAPATSSGDHGGLSLPTVSINGASGTELSTAIGTVLRFSRGGVTYTVLGSVPAVAAEAAARAL